MFILLLILFGVIIYIFIKHRKKQVVISKYEFYKEQYTKLKGDMDVFVKKYPEFFSFITKNFAVLYKIHSQSDLFYGLKFFIEEQLRDLRNTLYREELCAVLTHKIPKKNLLAHQVKDLCNSCECVPNIINQNKTALHEQFKYSLLNHLHMAGNPVDGEKIDIRYPEILSQINSISLKYMESSPDKKEHILKKLHKIGTEFFNKHKQIELHSNIPGPIYSWLYRTDLASTYLHIRTERKSEKDRLDNALKEIYKNHKITKETYEEYTNTLNLLIDCRKISESEQKKVLSIEKEIEKAYIESCITDGDVNDYIALSEMLTFILLWDDCPHACNYEYCGFTSRSEIAEIRKKMLDSTCHGINPLVLFKPENFEADQHCSDNPSLRHWGIFAKLKSDIDAALADYYPVPDFLSHAFEIVQSYKMIYDVLDSKHNRIQSELSKMSKYELFGLKTGIIIYCYEHPGKRSVFHGCFEDKMLEQYTQDYFDDIFNKFRDILAFYKAEYVYTLCENV